MKKVCSDCGLKQPLSAFNKDSTRKDGLDYCCKQCTRAASTRDHRKHKEQRNIASLRYTHAHPKQQRANEVRYRERHRARHRASLARYRERNIERVRERDRRWNHEHPESCRANIRRRRARKQAVSENFTIEMAQLVREFWANQCAVCGETEKLCIDHWLPLSLGYALTPGNAVLLCRSCNGGKGAKLPEAAYTPDFVKAVEQRLRRQARQWSTVAGVA